MVTIADVAKYAGVSRSTVSHALSGKRPISDETKRRIAAAIEALDYTANAGARALATSRSNIMGLVVPFTPEEFEPATMQYVLMITHTARSLGYDVLMVTDQEGTAGISRITASNLVDGVIVLDIKRYDDRIEHLRNTARPSVLVGIPQESSGIDSVDLDFAEAARSLVGHLHALGHRSVVFLTLPRALFDQDLGYAWRFHDSAVARAQELGMRLIPVPASTDPDSRAAEIAAALDANPEATALLVHNDGALVDLADVLEARGVRVPEDLSVVSIFPEQFGRMFRLSYTAIETSATSVAEQAVRLLAARIEVPDTPVMTTLIAPKIIDRGTSRPV